MRNEATPIADNMRITQSSEVHGRQVLRGFIGEGECAVVVCGVGKVNAAAGAQYAIDCLGADRIVNVGVAGGLNGTMSVGDVYSVDSCVQYDFNLAELNGTSIGTLNEYEEPYIRINTAGGYPKRKLATGDRFDDDEGDFKLLTSTLSADIRDMEGGAIAHVCAHANVPCYIFKAISDVAGMGSTHEQFRKNLEKCAQTLSKEAVNIFNAVNNDKRGNVGDKKGGV